MIDHGTECPIEAILTGEDAMKVNERLIPTPKEIQHVRDGIRRSWSPRERDERGRLAESRQARLSDHGSLAIMQLMHAGALSQRQEAGRIIAPSAALPLGEMMPEYGGSGPYRLPSAMTATGLTQVRKGFVAAARRARRADSTASKSTPRTVICLTSSSPNTRIAAMTSTAGQCRREFGFRQR